PQKKNPDVPELARGKTGRVYGHLTSLLTLMKGQPLAYNKDNQEDKEPLFDTADTLTNTLTIFAEMMEGLRVKPDNMRAATLQGYATATDLADALVKKGMPFRDAHEAVALAVRHCEDNQCGLEDLSVEQLQGALNLPHLGYGNELIDSEITKVLTLEGSLNARDHLGGTNPSRVKEAAQACLNRVAGQ
ncbi:MAG: argininosuccinate lyase, partial [Limnobacter sp.]|nr:argininosuccinate lyase [Limnobacter sp.]